MDSPQYFRLDLSIEISVDSFKPYYKWIVLNTDKKISDSSNLNSF